MRLHASILSILAPVILMITACENEGRQKIAEEKNSTEPIPIAQESVEATPSTESPKEPTCVKISTKFVEVTQDNIEELGFDWITEPYGTNTSPPEDKSSTDH